MQNEKNYSSFINLLSKKSKYKEYILPTGDIVYLQGYEDYVLEEIILKKYDLNDIFIRNEDITKEIGVIYYEYKGNNHKYYPDFFIKSENLIIEVKSDYTMTLNPDIIELKKKSCENNNLKFEFFVVDGNTYRKWKRLKNKKYNLCKNLKN